MIKFLCLILLLSQMVFADKTFRPASLLMLDSMFTHHVILVEKSSHKLYLFKNNQGYPELIKTYPIATGKYKGNKLTQGDHRTPEGVYIINEFIPREELDRRYGDYAKIYGSGAFPMNYPNFIDSMKGKTGGGIWLHSSDDESRVFKGLDSRGCVVVQNQHLKDISQYVELSKTPIVITQDAFFLPDETWTKNRQEIQAIIETWMSAWQTKDFDTYISAYDIDEFKDPIRGRFNAFRNYKKAVFQRKDDWNIKFDHLSILSAGDYALVQIRQDYTSEIINDVGVKTLYLRKNQNYDWKIVGELWSKLETNHLSFTPSMRFFKE